MHVGRREGVLDVRGEAFFVSNFFPLKERVKASKKGKLFSPADVDKFVKYVCSLYCQRSHQAEETEREGLNSQPRLKTSGIVRIRVNFVISRRKRKAFSSASLFVVFLS